MLLQEAGISELLMAPGKLADTVPGISGTRCLADNLSDLRAQVSRVARPLESGKTRCLVSVALGAWWTTSAI
jgi:hypothetical protein